MKRLLASVAVLGLMTGAAYAESLTMAVSIPLKYDSLTGPIRQLP